MRKYVEELKDYIFANLSEEGLFSKKYSEIAIALGCTQQQARNAMLDVLKGSLLEVIQPSKKGIGSNPIYKIKSHSVVNVKETHPTEDENTKTIIFEGVEVTLILTELGYVLAKEDLAICTLENVITIDKIISSNPELFKDHITIVNGKDYLDRTAVITYMMKVNLDKVHPVKRNLVAQFQSQIVALMCESQLRARIHITEDRHIKIRHNLNCILELDPEQVENMLTDLEYQISKTVEGYSTKLIQQDRQIHKLEKKTQQLSSQVEVEKVAKNNLITENQSLRNQLLERQ